jgi:hypothetical protein
VGSVALSQHWRRNCVSRAAHSTAKAQHAQRLRLIRNSCAAEAVLQATNEKVQGITAVMDSLRKEGLVPAQQFSTPIQFDEFDAWHFYGRTAKHGAFMGGADFVQWHGNYELLRLRTKIDDAALELRAEHTAK